MIVRGAARMVFLTRRHAYKVPRLDSFRGLLWGLLSNMAEAGRAPDPALCPVLWSLPGGLLVVMPRVRPAPLELLPDPADTSTDDPDAWKADSYGLYRGRVVRTDYHGAVDPTAQTAAQAAQPEGAI